MTNVWIYPGDELASIICLYRRNALTRPEAANAVRELLARTESIEDSCGGSFPSLDHFRDQCWDFLLS